MLENAPYFKKRNEQQGVLKAMGNGGDVEMGE